MRWPRRAYPLLLAMLASLHAPPAEADLPAAAGGGLHVVRRYAIPITEYRWQACWRGRLNPFAPPYLVWELVPCTRWEWRCEVVAIPPPPGTLQTLETPYRRQAPGGPSVGGVQRLEAGPPRVGPRMAERPAASAKRLDAAVSPGRPKTATGRAATRAAQDASDQSWRPARASLR